MTQSELTEAVLDPNVAIIDICIASIFQKCAARGDYMRLMFLIERAIGRAPITAETDEEKEMRLELRNLGNTELLQLIKSKIPELEAEKKSDECPQLKA